MKINIFFLAVSLLLAMAFVFSCSSDNKDEDKDKGEDKDKSGYCLDSYYLGSDYCIKGSCNNAFGLSDSRFSDDCPPGSDDSPKACIFPDGWKCWIITPVPVVGTTKLLESECVDMGGIVTYYNVSCVR